MRIRPVLPRDRGRLHRLPRRLHVQRPGNRDAYPLRQGHVLPRQVLFLHIVPRGVPVPGQEEQDAVRCRILQPQRNGQLRVVPAGIRMRIVGHTHSLWTWTVLCRRISVSRILLLLISVIIVLVPSVPLATIAPRPPLLPSLVSSGSIRTRSGRPPARNAQTATNASTRHRHQSSAPLGSSPTNSTSSVW